MNRLISALHAFKERLPYVIPRFVASAVGKIISLLPCFGNVSLIMSRFLQSAVTFRDAWDTTLDLGRFQYYSHCLDEINFWLKNCVKLNCRKLIEYTRPACIICTDASDFACGGACLFLLIRRSLSFFTKLFVPWNPRLTAMVWSYSRSFVHSNRLSRSFRAKWSNCLLTAKMPQLFLPRVVCHLDFSARPWKFFSFVLLITCLLSSSGSPGLLTSMLIR